MAKRSKKEKQQPNFVIFLVEGESDRIALETPLSELIFEKYPEYEVRFLLQQKYVSKNGEEFDCDDEDDGFLTEDEYVSGGDITTSSYVTPDKIEQKITTRYILPAIKSEGIYPKRIAKIIQITDLDGAYLPEDCVTSFYKGRESWNGPYYNSDDKVIETDDIDGIVDRNRRKCSNVDYLYSLSSEGIKIKQKKIPYEIYFFSSNLDHFINNDANIEGGKKRLADRFLRSYGLFTDKFCNYFFQDDGAIGKLGYSESWDMIREGKNSIGRYTNIDCLIRKLVD